MLRRTFIINKNFLILPVRSVDPKGMRPVATGQMKFLVNGKKIRWCDIDLAEDEGSYKVFADVSAFLGKELTLELEDPKVSSLEKIFLSDIPVNSNNLYKEELRPQFHFSSRRGWNNDPNGLFFQNGEYHLLYQHNPYSVHWGNLHWGHAVSKDLVHWKEMPVAIYPDEHGAISTGSTVIDHQNTSGLGSVANPAAVAIYTAGHASWVEKFTQCIAYSVDQGRSWSKYDGNPVMDHIMYKNRDPKVIWHEEGERWVMVLYIDRNDYAIFTSKNLLEWEHQSDLTIPRATECPEMFSLPVDGNPDEKKWIFWVANSTYLIGDFDGRVFHPEQEGRKLQPSGDSYAAQTWSDIPESDGRRIQIAWLRQNMPGMPWGQCMTVPQNLALVRREKEIVLLAQPVEELKTLRSEPWSIVEVDIQAGHVVIAEITGELFDIEIDLQIGTAECLGLIVRGIPVFYDCRYSSLVCGGNTVSVPAIQERLTWRILVDKMSIELYADQGALTIAHGCLIPEWERTVKVFSHRGTATISSMKIWQMCSTW